MKQIRIICTLFITIFLWTEGSLAQIKKISDLSVISLAVKEVEKHPGNLQKHQNYISAVAKTYSGLVAKQDTLLNRQYEYWTKRFPKEPVVFYAYSLLYKNMNKIDQQITLLSKAVLLDPKYEQAWNDLTDLAFTKGDDSLQRQSAWQLAKLDTANAAYALAYAQSYANSDTVTYHQLLKQIALKNPDSETGARALFAIAWDLKDKSFCEFYYEWLRKDFSSYKSDPMEIYTTGFENGMISYYNYLLKKDQPAALSLAEEICWKPAVNQHGDWKERILLAKNYIRLKELIKNGQSDEAIRLIDEQKPRHEVFYPLKEEYYDLKLQLLAATGKVKQAYDSTFAKYVRYPDSHTGEQLWDFGIRLGKSKNTVQKEVRMRRIDSAKTADNFYLTDYNTRRKVSLKSMRGKLVMLTYWFPSCGPCKAEFEHFEKVLKKYSRDDIVYVAINLENIQQDAVPSQVKAKGYSFISLMDDMSWSKGNLGARSAPVNYLISKEGKIIFDHFFISQEKDEPVLEQMIRDAKTIHDIIPEEKQLLSDSGQTN